MRRGTRETRETTTKSGIIFLCVPVVSVVSFVPKNPTRKLQASDNTLTAPTLLLPPLPLASLGANYHFSGAVSIRPNTRSGDNSGGVINNIVRHREELHLRAVVIPTWVYAILWRSSFVYTSALIRRSPNSAPHSTHDYQSHSARLYKQRKTPTSEHSGVITLRKLILAPPRGDDIYISFSYSFRIIFICPTGIYD